MTPILIKTDSKVAFKSNDYNFYFDKKTGYFERYGKTIDDDPEFSKYGPELADIEIATICHGVGKPCSFCYKRNNPNGQYMTIDTFKELFHKLPKTILQIAFGIGDIDSNPDMWKIFEYCRENGVIPNVTINGEGITDDIAKKLVENCGAVAVSYYDKEKTFNAIEKLTMLGLKQCNIHYMISEETYDKALTLIDDYKTDNRLKKLNAIVFLSLKKKGRAENHYTQLSQNNFDNLVDVALKNNVPIGFDSCSAFKFMKSVNYDEKYDMYIEPCESSRFSLYINVKGEFYPCSFTEGIDTGNGGDWTNGINVLTSNSFLNDVWFNDKTKMFRSECINCVNNKKSCLYYEI